ncbi:GIY-YIG nuclease family protein [Cobetia sp. ICG0124]|uniref:GIY-YIG nuclease family protein n=1 Tax=Cobetia sp. ICG0124 TaxID=2053669 RepID=UPI000FDB007B|nr:GIY-YIG nuclease family protein [Cobetia sp. ICG0124]AZV32037.1 hypothetical protein CU110_12595 [Cobetia sp. ICG0124]
MYVLETAQGRLYTGISTDVTRRLSEHAGGKRGARALRGKGPLTLCYQQAVGDRSRALKLEYRVKQLSVSAKRRLIAGELTLESLLGFRSEQVISAASSSDAGSDSGHPRSRSCRS